MWLREQLEYVGGYVMPAGCRLVVCPLEIRALKATPAAAGGSDIDAVDALVRHITKETGQKPFVCVVPWGLTVIQRELVTDIKPEKEARPWTR